MSTIDAMAVGLKKKIPKRKFFKKNLTRNYFYLGNWRKWMTSKYYKER